MQSQWGNEGGVGVGVGNRRTNIERQSCTLTFTLLRTLYSHQIHLTCMSLACRRKLENSEGTHTETGTTCKLRYVMIRLFKNHQILNLRTTAVHHFQRTGSPQGCVLSPLLFTLMTHPTTSWSLLMTQLLWASPRVTNWPTGTRWKAWWTGARSTTWSSMLTRQRQSMLTWGNLGPVIHHSSSMTLRWRSSVAQSSWGCKSLKN